MPTTSIRILIVDDHPALRFDLCAMIGKEPDMTVVAETGDGAESVKLFQDHQPDIVLMDLRLPGMSGVEAILAIRHHDPAARIVINTTYDADEDIHRAIQSGAKSYLLMDMPKEENTIVEVCSVTPSSIYMWARSGVIPCIRISQNTVRFVPGHVETALGLPHGLIRPQIPKKQIHPLDRRLERRWR